MPTVRDVDGGLAVTPEPIHVCVCSPDEELRTWLVDELLLMTWIGALELESVADLSNTSLRRLDLLIVGIDRLAASDLESLRERPRAAPVIAIGEGQELGHFDRVFGPRLTSRQLKQAIRELVFEPRLKRQPLR